MADVVVLADPPQLPPYASLAFNATVDPASLQQLTKNPEDPTIRHGAASQIVSADYFANNDDILRGRAKVSFTLVGQHFSAVDIRDITVRVVSKQPSPTASILWAAPQGSSDVGTIGFDLNSPDNRARVLNARNMPTSTDYFDSKQVTLAKNEPFRFEADVVGGGADYKFLLEVHFVDGTQVQIADNGHPWELNSFSRSYDQSMTLTAGDTGLEIVACQWGPDCQKR